MEMVGKLVLVGVLLTASCGRLGFGEIDPSVPPDIDASITDPPPPQNMLNCGEPQRFQIGAAGVSTMTAVPTPAGYSVFTVDNSGNLAGWNYQWTALGLAATTENHALDTDVTDSIGGVMVGTDLVVAAIHGRASATGTNVYPLAADLSSRAPMAVLSEIAGDTSPIAQSGAGAGLALAIVDGSTSEVDARAVSTLGAFTAAPVKVVDGTLLARAVSIQPAGTGFVMAWSETMGSPNALRIALLDANLAIVAGPVTANTSSYDPASPHVVYAPTSHAYMVSWHEKNSTGDDDVWMQLLDANLSPITFAAAIGTYGYQSMIATDGTDFWITWRSYTTAPDHLEAVRVTPTGVMTPRPIAGSGGAPKHYTMLEREGQTVLLWTETGGNGPDLWLDAMSCP